MVILCGGGDDLCVVEVVMVVMEAVVEEEEVMVVVATLRIQSGKSLAIMKTIQCLVNEISLVTSAAYKTWLSDWLQGASPSPQKSNQRRCRLWWFW